MDAQEVPGHVLIADDHPLFRSALRQVIAAISPACAVTEADCLDRAAAAAREHDLDLILLDINMPGMEGFNGLISLLNAVPATPVLVVSADSRPDTIQRAMTLGAAGFMPKSMDVEEMTGAVRAVLAGEVFVPADPGGGAPAHGRDDHGDFRHRYESLTPQQRKVLEMLVRGKPNKVIAYEMDVTESTVKAHVSAILHKLNVTSRTQAVLNASKLLED
jgi:DNA-binding NarL/FixJ family response regulator